MEERKINKAHCYDCGVLLEYRGIEKKDPILPNNTQRIVYNYYCKNCNKIIQRDTVVLIEEEPKPESESEPE